jgi:hypothetical protein
VVHTSEAVAERAEVADVAEEAIASLLSDQLRHDDLAEGRTRGCAGMTRAVPVTLCEDSRMVLWWRESHDQEESALLGGELPPRLKGGGPVPGGA